ncbi:FlgO family outer membrane protein [Megalodesulfovibrio gigas]|nr:FlgO family outer membrane protein [Megalodesulfovibrio gigas]
MLPAQAASAGRPRVVAILGFEFLGEVSGGRASINATAAHRGRMVTEMFTTEAVRSGVFHVVERTVLDTVLAEMEFGDAGLSGSAAQKIGRMVNADAVLSGAVSEYRGELRIDARLINVADGRVVLADKAFAADTLPSISDAVEEVLEKMADALAPTTGTPDAHSLANAPVKAPAALQFSARAAQPLPAAAVRVTASSFDAPTEQANFEPDNVTDGDPTTAWVEGGGEGGTGEWLRIAFDTPQQVTDIQCVNGMGAPAMFAQYSRIQDLEVELSTGRRVRVQLQDANGWQPMVRVDETVSWIAFHIVSVYPGERARRAALSEVEIAVGGTPR